MLRYDGTDFHGWQYQDGCRTVEGVLRNALSELSKGPVQTTGASRTDTGVHALGNCALATVETDLGIDDLHRAIEALTPADLCIVECRDAGPSFHPRCDAIEKRYLYRIHVGRRAPVFGDRHQWWHRSRLEGFAVRVLLPNRHRSPTRRQRSVATCTRSGWPAQPERTIRGANRSSAARFTTETRSRSVASRGMPVCSERLPTWVR